MALSLVDEALIRVVNAVRITQGLAPLTESQFLAAREENLDVLKVDTRAIAFDPSTVSDPLAAEGNLDIPEAPALSPFPDTGGVGGVGAASIDVALPTTLLQSFTDLTTVQKVVIAVVGGTLLFFIFQAVK